MTTDNQLQNPSDTTTIQFQNILPPNRLGQSHDPISSFLKEVNNKSNSRKSATTTTKWKEYTLILITRAHTKQILLGLKHRGFGTGFYNGFGGKIDRSDESPEHGAVRELHEETNITGISVEVMKQNKCGMLRFTFDNDNDDTGMMVHLYRIDLDHLTAASSNIMVDASCIQGCDEITPVWFDRWEDIPFQKMHADDSIWYPIVLGVPPGGVTLDAHVHFAAGGTDVNTILHYYFHVRYNNNAGNDTDTDTITAAIKEETTTTTTTTRSNNRYVLARTEQR